MIYYLKGTVVHKEQDTIVIDVHDVAYEILVSHSDIYELGQKAVVYTYNVIKDNNEYLVGFSSLEEKNVFSLLIKVKGVGPKSAINILSKTTPESVINAIESNNVLFLKKLQGVGTKAASQIILDLKGQLTGSKGNPNQYDEVREALKQLGFKTKKIDEALSQVNVRNGSNEEILKEALKLLRSKL
ncbi:MAG: Holliday junction branch migration protein RuvA [Bacilli bacterium]|nr:Holliday junction branch migration protein RuvA [Bacilli bacterium]